MQIKVNKKRTRLIDLRVHIQIKGVCLYFAAIFNLTVTYGSSVKPNKVLCFYSGTSVSDSYLLASSAREKRFAKRSL